MKTIFAMVIAAPILALFIGIAAWVITMAGCWTPTNTDVLVGGIVSACTTGGIVMALILSALIAWCFTVASSKIAIMYRHVASRGISNFTASANDLAGGTAADADDESIKRGMAKPGARNVRCMARRTQKQW